MIMNICKRVECNAFTGRNMFSSLSPIKLFLFFICAAIVVIVLCLVCTLLLYTSFIHDIILCGCKHNSFLFVAIFTVGLLIDSRCSSENSFVVK